MARGITEIDVHTAADELVTKGERPTVERIRAHLGTGSPNTVTRWLETWWQDLGPRLHSHGVRVAIPDAPEALLDLAGQWWSLALASARSIADQALADDRAQLEAERAYLQQASAALESHGRGIEGQLAAARHAEQLALTQTAELQRLISQLQGQLAETSKQRDAALAQSDHAREVISQLQRQLDQQLVTFQAERARLGEHARAIEDRAYQEVDRSRQEVKELKTQLSAANKERARREKDAATNAQRAARELSRLIQDAAAQRARADALETQLSSLKDLSTAVRTALLPAKAKAAGASTPGLGRQSLGQKTRIRKSTRKGKVRKINDKRELGEKDSN